jgi:hypothetical protein
VLAEVDVSGVAQGARKYDVYGATRSYAGTPVSRQAFVGQLGHATDTMRYVQSVRELIGVTTNGSLRPLTIKFALVAFGRTNCGAPVSFIQWQSRNLRQQNKDIMPALMNSRANGTFRRISLALSIHFFD